MKRKKDEVGSQNNSDNKVAGSIGVIIGILSLSASGVTGWHCLNFFRDHNYSRLTSNFLSLLAGVITGFATFIVLGFVFIIVARIWLFIIRGR